MNLDKIKVPTYEFAIQDWLEFEQMIALLRDKLKGGTELTFDKIQDAFAEISDNNEKMSEAIQRFFLEFVKINLQ